MLLADGASVIWSFFAQNLNESTLGIEPICLIDAWHLLEKLAAAATLLEGRGRVKPWTFKEWRRAIYGQQDGVAKVLAALTATDGRMLGSDGKRPVHEVMTYTEKRLPFMKYYDALERGLPIGSGNVEATCKSLVSVRMKRPGARWKPRGAEHILGLRALYLSDPLAAGDYSRAPAATHAGTRHQRARGELLAARRATPDGGLRRARRNQFTAVSTTPDGDHHVIKIRPATVRMRLRAQEQLYPPDTN